MSGLKTPYFSLFPQEDHRFHRHGIEAAMLRVMNSGQYVMGEEGRAFEAAFARFVGANHAVGVGSGTDAIEVMLRSLGIGPGDKVVVPSLAPAAVAAGVMRSGASVLLADCEPDTFTLCPRSLNALLRLPAGRGVKAALVVHLYGHMADWEGLSRVAQEHGILLLEDGAQAHGATWQGHHAGTLGKAAAFSFYPTKNLGAMGDAGAVVTQDAVLADRVRMIRQYGWRQQRAYSEMEGVNSRMDELQAAVLQVKLATLEKRLITRRQLAECYHRQLRKCDLVQPPVVRPGCEHAWHLYVVRSDRRDELLARLQSAGIPVARHYVAALHQQRPLAGRGMTPVPLPETERAVREILTLPLHPYLSVQAVEAVCGVIEAFACHACR